MRSRSIIFAVCTAVLVTVWLSAQPGAEARKVRLGLFTAMPAKWELDRNWETFQRTFLAHANEGIDVVVTPECFLDGYVASAKDWTPEHFAQIAQDVSRSSYIARVRAMAEKYKTAILFGFTEKAGSRIYNCALMVDRNGRVAGHYHKTHLQAQDLRFSSGEALPVFDMQWGKTGVLICADRRWPETARVLRLRGAGIILIPSYGMWHQDNEWWMRTRSYENENFIAFVHPNVAFVSDPKGQVVAKLQSNVPGMLVCDVDLSRVSDTTHIKDRRPELYKAITEDK